MNIFSIIRWLCKWSLIGLAAELYPFPLMVWLFVNKIPDRVWQSNVGLGKLEPAQPDQRNYSWWLFGLVLIAISDD